MTVDNFESRGRPSGGLHHLGEVVEQGIQEAIDPKARRRALWRDINLAFAGKPKSFIVRLYRGQRALIAMDWPEAHEKTSEEPQQDEQPTHTEAAVPSPEPVPSSTPSVVPEHSGIVFDPDALRLSQGFVYRKVNGSWKPILSSSTDFSGK